MTQTTDSHAAVGKSSAAGAARPRSHLRGLLAGLIVVIGGVAAFWWLNRDADSVAAEKAKPSKAAIAEVTPQIQTNAPIAEIDKPIEVAVPVKPQLPVEGKLVRAVTNKTGAVVEDYVMPNGEKRRKVKHPPQVWHNAADQMIAMALSIRPGEEAAPLPTGISDEEVRRALKEPIVIKDDDSERIKELKREVEAARADILAEMDATGRSFDQIIQEYHAEMNDKTKLYQVAVKELVEIQKTCSPEEVRRYKIRANVMLQQMGAKELEFTDEELDLPAETTENKTNAIDGNKEDDNDEH